MEDVLDIYHSEYDQQNPWLCFDESCKQLVKETKEKTAILILKSNK